MREGDELREGEWGRESRNGRMYISACYLLVFSLPLKRFLCYIFSIVYYLLNALR